MDEFFQQLANDPWGRLVLQQVATGGLWNCYLLLLVGSRLSGVFLLAPYFQTTTIPLSIRAGLVVMLSLIIAPTLTDLSPAHSNVTMIGHQSSVTGGLPGTVADLACVVVNEVGLGGLLGIGMITVFSGLRLGGEWLNRHSGIGIATALNPDWSGGDSACGLLVQMSGIAAFLLIEPVGGEQILLGSLVHSFHAIPVASASWSMPVVEILSGVVQQSLVLGLRIAMPLIATMTLIDVTISFVSRDLPQQLSSFFLAARTSVGLIMLALTMTSLPEAISTSLLSILTLINGVT